MRSQNHDYYGIVEPSDLSTDMEQVFNDYHHLLQQQGAELLSYSTDSEDLVFRVNHFSTYGLTNLQQSPRASRIIPVATAAQPAEEIPPPNSTSMALR